MCVSFTVQRELVDVLKRTVCEISSIGEFRNRISNERWILVEWKRMQYAAFAFQGNTRNNAIWSPTFKIVAIIVNRYFLLDLSKYSTSDVNESPKG